MDSQHLKRLPAQGRCPRSWLSYLRSTEGEAGFALLPAVRFGAGLSPCSTRPAQLCPSKAGWSLASRGMELQAPGPDYMGRKPSSTRLRIRWEGAHQPQRQARASDREAVRAPL